MESLKTKLDETFPFPRFTKIYEIKEEIGSGAFGRVVKADAMGITGAKETSTTVAVKMVKRDADISYIKALMAELKIMIHLGKVKSSTNKPEQ